MNERPNVVATPLKRIYERRIKLSSSVHPITEERTQRSDKFRETDSVG